MPSQNSLPRSNTLVGRRAVLSLAILLSQQFHSARAQSTGRIVLPPIQLSFTTLSVTIQNSFTVSYGASVNVCANVTPLGHLPSLRFNSDPDDALSIQALAIPCSGSNVTLTVKAKSDVLCSPLAIIQVLNSNGAPLYDGSGNPLQSMGTIVLPGSERSSFSQNYNCTQAHTSAINPGLFAPGLGGIAQWNITYQSQGAAAADFSNLIASETVSSIIFPGIPICPFGGPDSFSTTAPIGTNNMLVNPDSVGYCPGITDPNSIAAGCMNPILYQDMYAGKCFLQRNIIGYKWNRDLSFATYRSDPNALSPAIPLSGQK